MTLTLRTLLAASSLALLVAAACSPQTPPATPPKPKTAAADVPAQPTPQMKVYPAAAAPVLRDKDGNAIPTNPEAYDVSSALPGRK